MADKKSLVAKLAEACDAVGGIEKKGTNQKQNYKYVRAADVAKAFRHELFGRGILLVSDEKELIPLEPIPTQSGGKLNMIGVKIEYTLRDSESDEVITASGYGIGMDSGDKAIYKAKTGALKYFLRGLGLIPDEKDDPENDADEPTFQKQPDGSFAKNQKLTGPPVTGVVGKNTETVQKPAPKKPEATKPAARKKAEASDYQPWGGVAGKTKATDFPFGENSLPPEQVQAANPVPAPPNAITPENPITDADVPFPGDAAAKSVVDRLPDEKERKVFMEKLIALKNKGYTGIREWLLKETGETLTNNIGLLRMTELVARLEAADKAGNLKQLLSN